MYFRMALSNVKKSMRDYLIYFLTLMFGICLFYVFNSIHSQQAVLKMNESQREMIEVMQMMINGISIFIAVILGLLIVYANRFLMKRRHKEMGIYLLLGMEKHQVSKILVIETFIIGIFALAAGLAAGIFISQGLAIVTAKMFVVKMKEFQFVFSTDAFVQTILYFAVIFFIVMIFNGITISKYKLIDLLNSAKKNQKLRVKKLWVSVVLFIISAVCIGTAYYMITENGMMKVDSQFKMSILLGIVGTFLFFLSLSGFLLRIVKSSKGFYYRGLNMFVLRQINSKITTTFISMTMLCLMLFLAISAFATGTGMASTVRQDLNKVTNFDYSFYDYSMAQKKITDEMYLVKKMKTDGIDLEKHADSIIPIEVYTPSKSDVKIGTFTKGRENLTSVNKKMILNAKDSPVSFMKLSQYNRFLKNLGKNPIHLKKDQYAVSCNYELIMDVFRDVIKDRQEITLNHQKMKPYPKMFTDAYVNSAMPMDGGTLIVRDEIISQMKMPVSICYTSVKWKDSEKGYTKKFEKILENKYPKRENTPYTNSFSKEEVYEQSAGLSTVITYVAIYIGIVFLITCAAVLALQQLSENADNISKYEMLEKIGTDRKMINGAIKAQIFMYFMIPLSLALVHSYVGIRTAGNVIASFGHMDITDAVIKSLITVLVIYGGYMMATYFGSRNMLKEKR